MIPLFSKEELDSANSRGKLKIQCECCKGQFWATKNSVLAALKDFGQKRLKFCSRKCFFQAKSKTKIIDCPNCHKLFKRTPSEIKKNNLNFCSLNCSVTYNNKHKKYGTRISKLEVWIQKKLKEARPELTFIFNSKEAIGSELDIYIPSLKLAFELNGIVHYEPIYGEKKFEQIQNNDAIKFQACLQNGIELHIINTSSLRNFKEDVGLKYFKLITEILDKK